ncbi:MAG: GcrA cell cycle regulator [Bradyrhizobium sp.]|nr:GcrA cell cycle regulator [Bradyrhizobium sp.]
MTESLGLSWTNERAETLRQRWASGATSSNIAAEFGISRSAVMGKLKRMNLFGTRRKPEPMQIRCRLSGVGRELMFRRNLTKHKERLGTIVGVSLDGHCWIVVWDGMANTSRKPHPKYCIDFLGPAGVAAVPVISKPNGDKGGSIVAAVKAARRRTTERKVNGNGGGIVIRVKAKRRRGNAPAERQVIEPHRIGDSLAELNAAISKRQRVTLIDLTPETCRAPLWGDEARSGFYCGSLEADLTENRPFCASHARFFYNGKTSAKPWLPGRG